jgi:thymidine phosphorylase
VFTKIPALNAERLIIVMAEAGAAAKKDPSRKMAWSMGVRLVKKLSEAEKEEDILSLFAAATSCFESAARGGQLVTQGT